MEQKLPPGRLVAFKPLEEKWNYYSMEDGTVLGVKVVVTKVLRLQGADGKPAYDAAGQPLYYFLSQNVVRVLTPEEYRALRAMEGPAT